MMKIFLGLLLVRFAGDDADRVRSRFRGLAPRAASLARRTRCAL